MAIVSDEPYAGLAKGAGAITRDSDARDLNFTAAVTVNAGRCTDEFTLSLALNTGQPDDLAGMHNKIDLIEAASAQTVDGK